MLTALLSQLEPVVDRAAQRAVRSAVLGVAVILFGLPGLGFLTAAAFIAIMQLHGAVIAALAVGLFYLLLALIAAVLLARPARPRLPVQAPLQQPTLPAAAARPPLGEAFVMGMETGRGFAQGFRSTR